MKTLLIQGKKVIDNNLNIFLDNALAREENAYKLIWHSGLFFRSLLNDTFKL
jgi:hypothetical protein